MEILKQAQEKGENVVLVGATGPVKTTTIESLVGLEKHGCPVERVVVIEECPEIACA